MTTRQHAPGPALARRLAHREDRTRVARSSARASRFVMQTHTLGAPSASPRALLIAVAIAVALFILGRRLRA